MVFEFSETGSCTPQFCLFIFFIFVLFLLLSSTDEKQAFYKTVEFVDSSVLKINCHFFLQFIAHKQNYKQKTLPFSLNVLTVISY